MRRRSLRSWWTICFRRSSPRIRWVWYFYQFLPQGSWTRIRSVKSASVSAPRVSEDRLSQSCPNLCPSNHYQNQLSKYASVSSPGIISKDHVSKIRFNFSLTNHKRVSGEKNQFQHLRQKITREDQAGMISLSLRTYRSSARNCLLSNIL
jgi:hypothetical protein